MLTSSKFKASSYPSIMLQNKTTLAKIYEFLNYEDYLNIYSLNRVSKEHVESSLNLELIKNINKKYFKRVFCPIDNKSKRISENKILTIKTFEIILDGILIKEKNLDLKLFFKHCAYLLSKMIFLKEIKISEIKILPLVLNCFKYLKDLYFSKSLTSIEIGDNVFNEEYNGILIKDLLNLNLSIQLQTLYFYKSTINDNTLDVITKFVKLSSSLKNLALTEVNIGGSYNSIKLLQTLQEKDQIETIDLSLNKFTSEAVGTIKELMNKEKSDLKELKLEYNEFIKTDIVNIISDFLPKENRLVTIQFEDSPVYCIKDTVDICIDEDVEFSQQNFIKSYASPNLKIQGIVLKRLDDLNLNAQKILTELISTSTITNVLLFLNNHKFKVISFYLDLILNTKFTKMTLDGLEEDENQFKEDNTKKVLEKIMKLKHLKYFGVNSLSYNNEWFRMFLNILDIHELERVSLTDIQKMDYKGISQLSMSLQLNKYLKRVDISNCSILSFNTSTKEYVVDCVKENKNIHILVIDDKKYK